MKFLSILLVGIFVFFLMGNIKAQPQQLCNEIICQATCSQLCVSAACSGICVNDACNCNCIPYMGSSAKQPQQKDANKQG
ncbi:hypothetical protein KGM_205561 [Danaus plexippus plexippus]|uniref:Uncharacterized protein n=1 Tax=Danaus plexippus plexippus TaxID=278856 RepID=A0A212F3F0_DANPL|nr:hypothetical protein KGM_205561 [Danaus plexippus plexippus]